MQGTAEEQFAAIAAAARVEALNAIDDILTDDESVDYLPPKQQPLEPQVQNKIIINKFLTLMKLTIVHLKLLQTVHWTPRVLK